MRKYNTYNAKPDKTNYHKFYRASFKKKKKKNSIPTKSRYPISNFNRTRSKLSAKRHPVARAWTEHRSNFISPWLEIYFYFFPKPASLSLSRYQSMRIRDRFNIGLGEHVSWFNKAWRASVLVAATIERWCEGATPWWWELAPARW